MKKCTNIFMCPFTFLEKYMHKQGTEAHAYHPNILGG